METRYMCVQIGASFASSQPLPPKEALLLAREAESRAVCASVRAGRGAVGRRMASAEAAWLYVATHRAREGGPATTVSRDDPMQRALPPMPDLLQGIDIHIHGGGGGVVDRASVCPICKSSERVRLVDQRQTRSADEPMTCFYKCACGKSWRD